MPHVITELCTKDALCVGVCPVDCIAGELKKLFPNARVLRMDLDTTQNKDDYISILTGFANYEADILVGT